MKIKKQFNNLKAGAKRVFVGLLITSMLSTATGIGSVFTYATVDEVLTSTEQQITETPTNEGETPKSTDDLLGNTPSDGESNNNANIVDDDNNEDGDDDNDVIIPENQYQNNNNDPANTNSDVTDPEVTDPDNDDNEDDVINNDDTENKQDEQQKDKKEEDGQQEEDRQKEDEEDNKSDGTIDENGENENTDSGKKGGTTDENTTEEHTHDYTYYYASNEDGTHEAYCECGEHETQNCDYGDGDYCDQCSYKEPEGETTECTEHSYVYTDNGDGTHTGVCSVCGDEVTEDHVFSDYEKTDAGTLKRSCTLCDCEEEKEDDGECVHEVDEWTDNGDGTHTGTCSLCDEEIAEEHNLSKWIWDGVSQHTRSCSDCDFSETEDCEFDEDGICTICNNYTGRSKLGALKAPKLGAPALIEQLYELFKENVQKNDELEYAGVNQSHYFATTSGKVHSSSNFDFFAKEVNVNCTQGDGKNVGDHSYNLTVTIGEKYTSGNIDNYGTYDLPDTYKTKIIEKDINTKTTVTIQEPDGVGGSNSVSKSNFTVFGFCGSGEHLAFADIDSNRMLAQSGNSYAISINTDTYSEKDAKIEHFFGEYIEHGAEGVFLTEGTDYTLDMSTPGSTVPVADGITKTTITATGKGNYTGACQGSFKLSLPNNFQVLYDGETVSDLNNKSFDDYVELSINGSGYEVSLDNENWATSVKFNEIGEWQNIPLYVRKQAGKEFRISVPLNSDQKLKINKRQMSKVQISSPIKYMDDEPYKLTYTPKDASTTDTLIEKKSDTETGDYTSEITGIAANKKYPIADGSTSYKMKFTAAGEQYEGDPIESNSFTIDKISLTLDGTTEKKTIYVGKVEIAPADSNKYEVALTSDESFKSKVVYDTCNVAAQNIQVLVKNKNSGKIVEQTIDDVLVDKGRFKSAGGRDDMTIYNKIQTNGYTSDEPYTVEFKLTDPHTMLVDGTDYEVKLYNSDDTEADIPLADNTTSYYWIVSAKDLSKYEGYEKLNPMKIKPLTLQFDGAALKSQPYDGFVTIKGPEGYKIGLSSDQLSDSIKYSSTGTDITLDVYLKKDTNNRIIKQTTEKFSITAVDISEAAGKVTLSDTIKYLDATPYTLKFTKSDYTLIEGEDKDYVTEIIDDSGNTTIPIASPTSSRIQNTIKFTGVGGFTGERTKKFTVDNQTLTFDGAALTDSKTYIGSATIASDGWQISLTPEGPYQNKLEYDKQGDNQSFYVYLRKNIGSGETERKNVTIAQKIDELTISPLPYDFESFFASTGGSPTPATGLVYSGTAQSLLENFKAPSVPTLPDDVTLEIVYSGTTPTSKEAEFKKTDSGSYDVLYNVTYKYKKYKDSSKKEILAEKTITVSKDYGTISIAKKDINDVVTASSNLVKTPAENLDYAASNVDFAKDAFTFKLGDTTLVEGTDYSKAVDMNLPSTGVPADVGGHYALNFKGKGNFTGDFKNTIEVAELEGFTYNGSKTLKEKYYDQVVIGAPTGYTISLTSDGDYVDTITYSEVGNKQSVHVYAKNATTGRIVSQNLTGITITGLQVLYDGKSVMAESYHDSVRISANGFEVSTSKDGEYSNYYTCNKAGKVPDFTLYFKDKTSDYTKEVTISGLVIVKDIDLPIKYNGGKYQDWFKTDVKITCEDSDGNILYKISEAGKNKFSNSYKVTEDGEHEYDLDFQNVKDKNDIQNFTLTIRIDRTAPKASIVIGEYKSSSFKENDTVALSANTALEVTIDPKKTPSSIDYILYTTSEKFYAAPGDLLKDISESSAYWNAYDDSSKPKLKKNKRHYYYAIIYDTAGNKTFLSTGAVIYDAQAPEMVSGATSESEDGKSFTVTPVGTDRLSGISNFMLIYKEITSDDMKKPEKDEMLKKGISIDATAEGNNTYSGKYTAKDLKEDKDYMVYLMAVDEAGNTSSVTQKTLRTNSRIEVENYVSTKFRTSDEIAMYAKQPKKATIISENAKSIKFFVSETFYATPEDVRTAIKEKNSDWKTYSSDYKPAAVKDQNNYIYALIENEDGSETYLSTGNIVYDTIAPKMSIATVTPSDSGEGSTVATGGTDELSGIGSFKYKYFVVEEGVTPTKPTKEDLFDNGTVIDVSKSAETAAMGTATITGLSPDNKYDFYFVAVDKAKNVSEVFYTQIDGKDAVPGGAAAGGSGSKANAGSEGLTPAPNGIAGSGDKQKSDKSSTGTGQKETKTETTGESSAPINRDPYIADATGNTKIGLAQTGGWTKISGEVKQADKGAVIEVEMSGTSNVSRQLFDAMNTKDVSVKLRMPNNVQWEIKGDAINQNNIADRDMGVKIGSRNIPDQHLNDIVGSNPHIEFSMTSQEDPGFEATITIPADQTNAGMNATLYKYDAETKEMTMVGTAIVDDNGNVQFPITDFADYTVVISPEKALMATETAVTEGVIEDEDLTRGGMIRLTDIFGQRGGAPIWLFVIAIISAGLCIAILYMPTFQAKDDDDFSNFA